MKQTVLGALVGAGLAIALVGAIDRGSEVFAQRPTGVQAPAAQLTPGNGELIVVPMPLNEKGQLLTVIDPRQQVMSVYHIELPSGKIALRSVRNFRWDLQMMYLNNDAPLPQEIRSLLDREGIK